MKTFKKLNTSPGGRIGMTADELIDLGHSDFAAITKKTMSQVPVYQYRFADLPESLSGAEILARNRKRWEQDYDVE